MKKRRAKKAFRKMVTFRPMSSAERRAAIDYSVKHYGSLSGPMLLADFARHEKMKKAMESVLTPIYTQWIREEMAAGIIAPAPLGAIASISWVQTREAIR